MAYIEVLAEYAAEVAPGKKYRPRPACSNEHTLFAKVRGYGANHGQTADAAKADLAFTAIDFTLARAKYTGIHIIPQLPDGFTKRIDIGWRR
jgi:hypothetical protein